MKLTIFAATGGTGRQVLEQAVAAGDEVTAVVKAEAGLLSRGIEAIIDAMTMRISDLDWTSVALLNDNPGAGIYRPANRQSMRGGFRLARADAAHFMLAALGRPETIRQSIAVAY
ncbi:MAG TPA: hypothetical protein VGD71_26590 [Kribbella sp.]|jgi:hypothetical protein